MGGGECVAPLCPGPPPPVLGAPSLPYAGLGHDSGAAGGPVVVAPLILTPMQKPGISNRVPGTSQRAVGSDLALFS